jgi:hypothetical protein
MPQNQSLLTNVPLVFRQIFGESHANLAKLGRALVDSEVLLLVVE